MECVPASAADYYRMAMQRSVTDLPKPQAQAHSVVLLARRWVSDGHALAWNQKQRVEGWCEGKALCCLLCQSLMERRMPASPADIIRAPSPLPHAPLNNSFGVTVMIYKHHIECRRGDFLGGWGVGRGFAGHVTGSSAEAYVASPVLTQTLRILQKHGWLTVEHGLMATILDKAESAERSQHN